MIGCQDGIRNAIKKYVDEKSYLRFNGRDFIEVLTSYKAKVNRSNYYRVAESVANKLNKDINILPASKLVSAANEIFPNEVRLPLSYYALPTKDFVEECNDWSMDVLGKMGISFLVFLCPQNAHSVSDDTSFFTST
jgi:hypothetical protein